MAGTTDYAYGPLQTARRSDGPGELVVWLQVTVRGPTVTVRLAEYDTDEV
jgi:hypothetical protein